MNIIMFVIFSVGLLLSLKPAYQVWFLPNEFERTLDRRRKSIKKLPAAFKKNDRRSHIFRKIVSVFILIICILGIIVSITGPI